MKNGWCGRRDGGDGGTWPDWEIGDRMAGQEIGVVGGQRCRMQRARPWPLCRTYTSDQGPCTPQSWPALCSVSPGGCLRSERAQKTWTPLFAPTPYLAADSKEKITSDKSSDCETRRVIKRYKEKVDSLNTAIHNCTYISHDQSAWLAGTTC